jgi:hypothetical protein
MQVVSGGYQGTTLKKEENHSCIVTVHHLAATNHRLIHHSHTALEMNDEAGK